MSDHDGDSSTWHLGMDLPSRKDTHGRKKKGDRKLEKQAEPLSKMQPTQQQPIQTEPGTEQDDLQQQAIVQMQEYWNESAATVVIPSEMATGSNGRDLGEDVLYLHNLLLPKPVMEGARGQDAVTDVESVADDAPVVSKWKIALLILLTPIVLIVVLAWGKLAYVHNVPTFVRQQVSAYQDGEGFLILKPWWFGPLIFTLDQYTRSEGEDFDHWKIQLNDYDEVVHDPNVLYMFPQDILK